MSIIKYDVLNNLQGHKGSSWSEKYRKINIDNFTAEDIILLIKDSNCAILENIALWKILDSEIDKKILSEIVTIILEQNPISFANLMAILAKKEIQEFELGKILDKIFDVPGYEYLMRLIHKHPNATKTIKKRLSESRLIDAKYKIL